MIRNRQHADNHVTGILKHLKTEKDRLMRGYQFAKIYYDIKEFGRAKDYLIGFLSILDNVPSAYKLLGQIHEDLKSPAQDIINAYKRSLELDPQQHNLILKICELYSTINISPETAAIWVAKLEKYFPNNNALIFKMKSKCIQTNDENKKANQDMITFYETELAKDDSHPWRCISLLKLYLAEGRVQDAFTYIMKTELKVKQEYTNCLEWYQFVDSFMEKHRKEDTKVDDDKMVKLMVLIRLLTLTLSTTFNYPSFVNIFWSLDKQLKKYQSDPDIKKSLVFNEVLKEAEAQYFFFAAILLFIKAQRDRMSWNEATSVGYTCLLVSNNYNSFDDKQKISNIVDAKLKAYLESVKQLFLLRLSQTGHMLHKRYGELNAYDILKGQIAHYSTIEGKKHLVELLFSANNKMDAWDESFIIKYNFQFQTPNHQTLSLIDRDVQLAYVSDLNTLVWICLHYFNDEPVQPEYPFDLSSSLRYSCEKWDSAAAETLTQLDLQLFLLLTVKYVSEQLKLSHLHMNENKPILLPLLICGRLSTEAQSSWWSAAQQLATNKGYETFGQLRWTIQQGLETIRMVGLNRLPLTFIAHAALSLEAKLSSNEDSTKKEFRKLSPIEINGLESLIGYLWDKAIAVASKPYTEAYQSTQLQKARLFDLKETAAPLSEEEQQEIINRGMLFKGKMLTKRQEYQQALSILENSATVEAKLQTSKVYTKLSELNGQENFLNVLDDLDDSKSTYLFKARETLLDALNDFKTDRHNPIHFEILREIDEIERKLNEYNTNDLPTSIVSENKTPTRVSQKLFASQSNGNQLFSSTPALSNPLNKSKESNEKNRSRIPQSPDRPDIQWRFCSDMINNIMQTVNIMKEEIRENRTTIQKLQEKMVTLELKQVELEQHKQKPSQALNSFPETGLNYMTNPVPFYQLPNPHFPIRTDFDLQRSLFPNRDIYTPQFFPQPFVHNLMPNIVPSFGSPGHHQTNIYPQQVPTSYQTSNYQQQDDNEDEFDEEDYTCQTTTFKKDGFFNIEPLSDASKVGPSTNTDPLRDCDINSKKIICSNEEKKSDTNNSSNAINEKPNLSCSSLAEVLKSATDEILMIKNKDKNSQKENLYPSVKSIAQSLPASGSTINASNNSIFNSPIAKSSAIVSSAGQTTFGGLTFSKAPSVLNSKDKVNLPTTKESDASSKPANAFAHFSFSKPTVDNNVLSKSPVTSKSSESAKVGTSDGTLSSKSSNTFNQLSSLSSTSTVSSQLENQRTTDIVATPNKPNLALDKNLFKVPVERKLAEQAQVKSPGEDHAEDFVPDVNFTPVISLPVVNVITGEEEEEKLFGERAKLYRLIGEPKEWKERGIGELKIAKNKKTGKARVLMRRDQVHKVCANHYINPDMNLIDFKNSANSFCWVAQDFSESEMKEEQFCVKFKTEDIARRFKECFLSCQKLEKEKTAIKSDIVDTKIQSQLDNKDKNESLAKLFAPKAGEWTCDACYVKNKAETTKCISCETVKPGIQTGDVKGSETKVVFGSQGGFKFMTDSCSNSVPFSFGTNIVSSDNDGLGKGFSFNNNASSENALSSASNITSKEFNFGSAGNKPAFRISDKENKPVFGSINAGTKSTLNYSSDKGSENKSIFGNFATQSNNLTFGNVCAGNKAMFEKVAEKKIENISTAGKTLEQGNLSTLPKTENQSKSFGGIVFGVSPNSGESIFGIKPSVSGENIFGVKDKPLNIFQQPSTMMDSKSQITGPNKIENESKVAHGMGSDIKTGANIFTTKLSVHQPSSNENSFVAARNCEQVQTTSGTNFFGAGSSFNFKPEGNIFGTKTASATKDKETSAINNIFKDTSQINDGNLFSKQPVPSSDTNNSFTNVNHVSTNIFGSKADQLNSKNVLDKNVDRCSIAKSNETDQTGMGSNIFGVEPSTSSENIFSVKLDQVTASNDIFGIKPIQASSRENIFGMNLSTSVFSDAFSSLKNNSFSFSNGTSQMKDSISLASSFSYTPLKTLSTDSFNFGLNSPINSQQREKSPNSPEDSFYVNKEGESDHITFEPIVQLPEKVDLKTGEEGCNVLFCNRAKVFRFCLDQKEWKERGVGDVKILQNAETKQCKILMRREKIFKICLNHVIQPPMKLQPQIHGQGRSWVWYTNDFSDGELVNEKFAIKFKDVDAANNFYKFFNIGLSKEKNDSESDDYCVVINVPELSAEEKENIIKYKLPPSFYDSKTTCPGCIGCAQNEYTSFNWNDVPDKPKQILPTKQGTLVPDKTKQIFPTKQETSKEINNHSPFSKSLSKMSDFASLVSENPSSSFKTDPNFKWASNAVPLFQNITINPKNDDTNEKEVDENEVVQSNADQIHFEPIVTLPEITDLKTGEEEEMEVFKERAVLYRFDQSSDPPQWKERGAGELKILKNSINGAYRILLRRDKVLKIACNHCISADIKMKPMQTNEKAVVWFANDFADGTPRMEQFSARFKTIDIMKEFMARVAKCQAELVLNKEGPPKSAKVVNPVNSNASVLTSLLMSSNKSDTTVSSSETSDKIVKEYEAGEEYDEDEETDDTPLFQKQATLTYKTDGNKIAVGVVDVLIHEDLDLSALRVTMRKGEDEVVANHIICKGYHLEKGDENRNKFWCEWVAKDYANDEAVRRTFCLTFSSLSSRNEFDTYFQQGLNMANDQCITESQQDEYYLADNWVKD